jgi:multiple sugar transport system permease protein
VLGLLIGYVVPVGLGVLVNEMRHGKSYFRLAFYLPVILPPMASLILWKMGLYNSDWGLLNMGLKSLGLPRVLWLDSTQWAMPSLVIFSTWANAGGTMLLYLAALQGVPAHLYDAAEIDGAGIGQRFLHITLPQIRGVMLILLVLQIIGTMQVFTEPFVMTGGGPANATLTLIMLVYRYAFSYGNFGVASALGFVLFVVLVIFSVLYLWLTRKFEA